MSYKDKPREEWTEQDYLDAVDLTVSEWDKKEYRLGNRIRDMHSGYMLYHYKTQSAPDKITLDELIMASKDCIYWLIMMHYIRDNPELQWGKLDTNLIGYVKHNREGEINLWQTKKYWRNEILSIMRKIHLELDSYNKMKVLMEKNTDWVYALLKMIYPRINFDVENIKVLV